MSFCDLARIHEFAIKDRLTLQKSLKLFYDEQT